MFSQFHTLPNRAENGTILWMCILDTGSDAQVPGGDEGVAVKTVYVLNVSISVKQEVDINCKPAASLAQRQYQEPRGKKKNVYS